MGNREEKMEDPVWRASWKAGAESQWMAYGSAITQCCWCFLICFVYPTLAYTCCKSEHSNFWNFVPNRDSRSFDLIRPEMTSSYLTPRQISWTRIQFEDVCWVSFYRNGCRCWWD